MLACSSVAPFLVACSIPRTVVRHGRLSSRYGIAMSVNSGLVAGQTIQASTPFVWIHAMRSW